MLIGCHLFQLQLPGDFLCKCDAVTNNNNVDVVDVLAEKFIADVAADNVSFNAQLIGNPSNAPQYRNVYFYFVNRH